MSETEATTTAPTWGELLAGCVDALTTAARQLDERGLGDFAELATLALAATAANVGGVEALLAGRPGSWEADGVRQLLHSTVGVDEEQLMRHRTEPLRITVNPTAVLDDLGYSDLYDDAEAALFAREDAIVWPDDGDPSDEQQAEIDRVEDLFGRLAELRAADAAAYGQALRDQVLAVVAEHHPEISVPVEVVVDDTWSPPVGRWALEDEIVSLARTRAALPGSNIALADHPDVFHIADVETAAGRDPLTRLAAEPGA